MTLHFADVSNWQQGMSLAGMPAVIAKATEGTGFVDGYYAGYKAQAATMGVPFVGYHYLHHGSIEAQAQLAFTVVGAGVPLMLDVEVVQGQPDPTFADVTQFVAAYRARGGRVTLIYLPQWFWSGHWGAPDLRPLAALGLALISSNYTTYSDTGPGWAAYGGVAPAIWQYTSSATINGRVNVDMNAYRGRAGQLRALLEGTSTVEEDMLSPCKQGDSGYAVWTLQTCLFLLGFGGPTDQHYGPETSKALAACCDYVGIHGGVQDGSVFGPSEYAAVHAAFGKRYGGGTPAAVDPEAVVAAVKAEVAKIHATTTLTAE